MSFWKDLNGSWAAIFDIWKGNSWLVVVVVVMVVVVVVAVSIPDALSVLVSIYVMVLSAPLCIGTARGADLSGENLNNNI